MRGRLRDEKTGKFKQSSDIRGVDPPYVMVSEQAGKYLRATAKRLNLTMAQFVERAVMQFAEAETVEAASTVPMPSKSSMKF